MQEVSINLNRMTIVVKHTLRVLTLFFRGIFPDFTQFSDFYYTGDLHCCLCCSYLYQ
jgi:hypothetical protein